MDNLKLKLEEIGKLVNDADSFGIRDTSDFDGVDSTIDEGWKVGQSIPYESKRGEKKSMKVIRVYKSKEDMDGPFPSGLVKLWKKSDNIKAALLAQCPMGEYYLVLAKQDGSTFGPVWLRPAQAKRALSYE